MPAHKGGTNNHIISVDIDDVHIGIILIYETQLKVSLGPKVDHGMASDHPKL
jgi:hypothetical protein